ncbi:hypothetical protein J2Z69_003136 [Paenibacillus shirakamiensis]|uniref:Uncharacterized protein n=1 Tax=Paenibacillus shirakamiensis TaxID=1265935 RepID=A0ABS4JN80_9BACL|nr:hypothetical protein [Paenibacillus shirakamiensis]MBP2002079.1 hypothetical protein [Paenibacillus shirakamiensis]
MNQLLTADLDFFAAALSQKMISAWQEDEAGVYCEIGRGPVEKYTPGYVRIRNIETGRKSHYARENTMFHVVE